MLTLTISGPYLQCPACRHPGPTGSAADGPVMVTFAQPTAADRFYLIPHSAGCRAPNPFNGPAATINFDAAVRVVSNG